MIRTSSSLGVSLFFLVYCLSFCYSLAFSLASCLLFFSSSFTYSFRLSWSGYYFLYWLSFSEDYSIVLLISCLPLTRSSPFDLKSLRLFYVSAYSFLDELFSACILYFKAMFYLSAFLNFPSSAWTLGLPFCWCLSNYFWRICRFY